MSLKSKVKSAVAAVFGNASVIDRLISDDVALKNLQEQKALATARAEELRTPAALSDEHWPAYKKALEEIERVGDEIGRKLHSREVLAPMAADALRAELPAAIERAERVAIAATDHQEKILYAIGVLLGKARALATRTPFVTLGAQWRLDFPQITAGMNGADAAEMPSLPALLSSPAANLEEATVYLNSLKNNGVEVLASERFSASSAQLRDAVIAAAKVLDQQRSEEFLCAENRRRMTEVKRWVDKALIFSPERGWVMFEGAFNRDVDKLRGLAAGLKAKMRVIYNIENVNGHVVGTIMVDLESNTVVERTPGLIVAEDAA